MKKTTVIITIEIDDKQGVGLPSIEVFGKEKKQKYNGILEKIRFSVSMLYNTLVDYEKKEKKKDDKPAS